MNKTKEKLPLTADAIARERLMNDKSAFPSSYTVPEVYHRDGLSAKEYAAIRLKVPRSGDPEIDAMIRESCRKDFAEKALRIIIDKDMLFPDAKYHDWMKYAAGQSFVLADAMLAAWEWEKEAGK
jgi:hypothetical protein